MSVGTQKFVLLSEDIKANAISFIANIPSSGEFEIIVRPITQQKTLKQLGALFGVWAKYEHEQTGDSIADIHRRWKKMFLARIYATEPRSAEQELWLDAITTAQEQGNFLRLERVAEKISLSWATLDQMSEYMNQIDAHYQSIGRPMPIPDKFWKLAKRLRNIDDLDHENR